MAQRERQTRKPFGQALEGLMEERGMTYRSLGERCNLSAGYLNHLVHGNRPVPDSEVIARLAAALDVRPDFFVETRLRVVCERLADHPLIADRLFRQLAR